ncbi:hypothetical protein KBC03_03675 [Patescibacteria group bacterium]|nr:hypothetical protein [Patescibacteria group bacterium]
MTKSTDSAILSDTGTIVSHAFAEAIKKGAIKGSPSEFNVIVARGHNYQTADMLK